MIRADRNVYPTSNKIELCWTENTPLQHHLRDAQGDAALIKLRLARKDSFGLRGVMNPKSTAVSTN